MKLPPCCYRISVKALILNETRDGFLVCYDQVGHWDLPGGGIEDDADPRTELSREIAEEMVLDTTWVAEHPSYFVTGSATESPELSIANVIYECTLANLDFTPTSECQEIRFMSPADTLDIPVSDGVAGLLKQFKPEKH